jgi:hypothetical protein
LRIGPVETPDSNGIVLARTRCLGFVASAKLAKTIVAGIASAKNA